MVAWVFIYLTLDTPVSRSSCLLCFEEFLSNFFPSLNSLWVCSDIFSVTDDTYPNTRGCSCGLGID